MIKTTLNHPKKKKSRIGENTNFLPFRVLGQQFMQKVMSGLEIDTILYSTLPADKSWPTNAEIKQTQILSRGGFRLR